MSTRRVVSLVPSLTRTMFDLGRGDWVVGVTRYCEEPAEAVRNLPRVGGTKNPRRARIAELSPDLVLVNTEENRAEDIAWLRQRFSVHESMPRTVQESAEMLRSLGRELSCEDAAEGLAGEIEDQAGKGGQAEQVAPAEQATPVRVFYAIWRNPWMSINEDTYIHDLLAVAGADNVCGGRAERYPTLRAADLAQVAEVAELVLLPTEPYAFGSKHRQELLDDRTFGDAAVMLVDGRDYCWHGSRTAAGLRRARELVREFRSRS